MKLFRFGSMLALTVATFSGCGSGPVEERLEVQTSQIGAALKATLENIAKSGKTGSALPALESDINGIKATDKAKGDELHKDFMRMQAATKPDEIKAIAKDMLGKL